jgi:hypothetical protein
MMFPQLISGLVSEFMKNRETWNLHSHPNAPQDFDTISTDLFVLGYISQKEEVKME